MNLKGKLTKAEKGWILYDVANSSYGLVIMTAVMPLFYKNYIAQGIPSDHSTADWGFANSIGGLLVALSAPLLGAIADTRRSKKYLLGLFMVLGVLSTAAFSITFPGMRIFTLSLYVLSLIGFAGGNVFYDALLTDVTTKRRMDYLSSAGYAWGYIGGAIPFIAFIILYLLIPSGTLSMRLSFIITALWWGLFSLPVFLYTRQKYSAGMTKGSFKDAFVTLLSTFRRVRQYRNVAIFLLAYFLYIDGVDTIIRMAIPYGSDIGLDSGMLMATVLGLQIAAFPFALLYARMAKVYGAKKLLYVAICVYCVITFLAFLLPEVSSVSVKLFIFFFVAFLIASSQGGIQALSRSFYGKIIPKQHSAEFFGFYNIFGKFATIFGPFLIGIAGQWLGDVKYGMLSLVVLFVAGGAILLNVKDESSV